MKKIEFANKQLIRSFLFFLLAVLVVGVIGAYATNPTEEAKDQILGTGAVVYAISMAAIGNIDTASGKYRAGKQIKAKVYILHYDQFDEASGFPAPNSNREVGTIPLLAGEYWHYAESVEDSPNVESVGEMGDIAPTLTNTLKFVIGGISANLETLLEDGIGEKFYIVTETCSTGAKRLYGNGCKPLKLTGFTGGQGTDYTGYELTFMNENSLPFAYTGTVQTQSPVSIAADATTQAFNATNLVYQFSANTGATDFEGFTGLTDNDVNKVVTFLGATSSTNASTIDAADGDFILAAGATWTASPGKSLTVRIMKTGASTYQLIEVSRV